MITELLFYLKAWSMLSLRAHSSRMRTPWMQDVKEFLIQEFSVDCARALLLETPGKILKDEPIPPVTPEWF